MPIRTSELRRERARERTRRDILLGAADVFARRGYAAATLAELAEAAGFAPPSLYRYFRSKEEIFRSLVELAVREMDATFEEPVDARLPLGQRLEALLRAQGRTAEALRAALVALDAAGPEVAEVLPALGHPRTGFEYYETRLLAWLRRHAAADELRQPLETAARAFTGLAFAFRRTAGDPKPPDPARLRLVVDLALHGIAAPAPRRRGATP